VVVKINFIIVVIHKVNQNQSLVTIITTFVFIKAINFQSYFMAIIIIIAKAISNFNL